MQTRLATLLSVLALVTAAGTSGCSSLERVCSSGERPVRTVDPSDSGLACAPDGEQPPPGYEDFPPGEAPEYVDDMY